MPQPWQHQSDWRSCPVLVLSDYRKRKSFSLEFSGQTNISVDLQVALESYDNKVIGEQASLYWRDRLLLGDSAPKLKLWKFWVNQGLVNPVYITLRRKGCSAWLEVCNSLFTFQTNKRDLAVKSPYIYLCLTAWLKQKLVKNQTSNSALIRRLVRTLTIRKPDLARNPFTRPTCDWHYYLYLDNTVIQTLSSQTTTQCQKKFLTRNFGLLN